MATTTGAALKTIVNAIYDKGTQTSTVNNYLNKYFTASTLEQTDSSTSLSTYTLDSNNILGLSSQTIILGTSFNDAVLSAPAKKSNLTGNDNNNILLGNEFDNKIVGGLGADTLYGAAGNDTIEGGDGGDNLSGGLGKDTLIGGAGNDTMTDQDSDANSGKGAYFDGGDGNDSMRGANKANDTMYGGSGNDSINGGGGSDVFYGGEGNDTISGSGNYSGGGDNVPNYSFKATVKAYGGAGSDRISISGSQIQVESDDKNDMVGGNDTVIGGVAEVSGKGAINTYRGNDSITGSGVGSLIIESDIKTDTVGGADTVNYGGSGKAAINTYYGNDVVNLTGLGKATVTTDLLTDTVGGEDTVSAEFGINDIKTGAGNDTVYLGAGTAEKVSGTNTIDTGAGDDVVTRIFTQESFNSYTNFGSNKISLGAGNDTVDLETAENDVIHTDPVLDEHGNQTYEQMTVAVDDFGNVVVVLVDGDGVPILDMSDNKQYLARNVDANGSEIQVNANGVVVTYDPEANVYTDANAVVYSFNVEQEAYLDTNGDPLGQLFSRYYKVDINGDAILDGENLQYVINNDGSGNSLNTIELMVDNLENPIFETLGTVTVDADFSKANDTIDGGDGNDSMMSGAGNDSVLGGKGDDTIAGGKGNDKLFGNDGNDSINGGAGKDTIDGGAGADILAGGASSDSLSGGDGNDVINGDAGNDTLTGGKGDDIFVFDDNSGFDIISDFSTTSTKVGGVTTITSDELRIDGHRDGDGNFELDDFSAEQWADGSLKGTLIFFNHGAGAVLLKGIALIDLKFDDDTDTFSILKGNNSLISDL